VRRTGITDNRRIGISSVDHESVIPNLRNKRTTKVAHNESRQNNEGIGLRDQEAPLLEIMDATLREIDTAFDLLETRRFQIRLLGLHREAFELLFLPNKKGIWPLRLLWPTITRLRKKELRRAINLEVTIPITAVSINVHVSQYQKGTSVSGRAFQVQNRLAVVKVMTRQYGIQPRQISFEISCLEIIEALKEWRHRCIGEQLGEVNKSPNQGGIGQQKILIRKEWAGKLGAESDLHLIGSWILAILRSHFFTRFGNNGGV
jgi:hypothetical protein